MFDDDGVFIPITEWRCFSQVAGIIGEAQAHVELYKVFNEILKETIEQSALTYNPLNLKNDILFAAFEWDLTPQGHEFWEDIAYKDNPNYEVAHC